MGAHTEVKDVAIVGGGQAGLVMSRLLTDQNRDHVVLEKGSRIGDSWRRKWNSFTLVTPNWQIQLPGMPYTGDEPEGFLARDEVAAYLESYAETFDPPIRFGVEVTSVARDEDRGTYRLATSDGDLECLTVVVAAGTFQKPRIPSVAEKVSPAIEQMHSSGYAEPGGLPEGAVLVVGSGQSGCQIAQELNEAGREVYLATGRAGRLPRRYRGRDGMWWAQRLGIMDQTADELDAPEERFTANPQVSGKGGGRDLDLHEFARDGIVLLGHLEDFRGETAIFATDLHDNLAMGDQMAASIRQAVDEYVEKTGMQLPVETVEQLEDGYQQGEIRELDLSKAGVSAIIWATGYSWDYSWIDLPVFDSDGYPIQTQGVTSCPGVYFVGLNWLHSRKSGLFLGIGEDAMHVAAHLAGRSPRLLGVEPLE